MALYSMKQLEEILDTTPQTIHRLLRQNEELKELTKEHIVKKEGRKVFYDDTILEWFKKYFGIDAGFNEQPMSGERAGGASKPPEVKDVGGTQADVKQTPPEDGEIEKLKRTIKELEERIENKDKLIEDLTTQLNNKEAERLHFITENGQLLGLLAAEKAEKQRLLPPPKVPFFERMKMIFSGKKEDKGDYRQ